MKNLKKLFIAILLITVSSCGSEKELQGAELYAQRVQEHIENGERVLAIDLLKEGIEKYDDETLKNLYFSLEGAQYAKEDTASAGESTPTQQPAVQTPAPTQAPANNSYTMDSFIDDIKLFMNYNYSITPKISTTAENSKYYQVEVYHQDYDGSWVFIGDKKTKTVFKYLEGSDYDYFYSKDENGIYISSEDPEEISLASFEKVLNLAAAQSFEIGKFFESHDLYEITNYDIINQNGALTKAVYDNYLLHPDGGIRLM